MSLAGNKLLISAVGVFLVFVLCVAYIISGVLGSPLTSRPTTVKVDLASTGGLYVGSQVSYRGTHIGKITAINFRPGGVQADAEITTGTKVPKNTKAVVRSLSPIGEQYLDFQPRTSSGPYLSDNEVLSVSQTQIPDTLASTVVAINKVLDQINPNQLHRVLAESSKALTGASGDLQQITQQGRQLVNTLTTQWPRINDLIDKSGTVLDIGTSEAPELRRFARDFNAFTLFLKNYNPQLIKTLHQAPGEIAQLRQLVRDANAILPSFLRNGGELMTLLAAYSPHLRALLQDFAPGLATLGQAVTGGQINFELYPWNDPPMCRYATTIHDPHTAPTPFQMNGHCSSSHPNLQRGAAHAPGPIRPTH